MAAGKIHINQETGEYGHCKAFVEKCPIAPDNEHVETVAEARNISENIMRIIHGGETKSLSKKLDSAAVTVEEEKKPKRQVPPASDVQPTVNHRYPYPEAHRLERMDEMLHGLRDGEVPPEGISSILGTKDRVSDFYGEAASFLGLADAVVDSRGNKAFTLTQDGADYIEQDTAGRQEILSRTINNIDIMETVRAEDHDAALDRISSTHGESRETSGRKLSSLRSWGRQVQKDDFLNDVDTEAVETRVSEGMEMYNRKQLDEQAQPKGRTGELCDSCFMEKPLVGGCPNCDD